jgi:2-keto-4-pentenoate hydratase
MAFDVAATVEEFWQARSRGEYFPRAWAGRLTLDQAYQVQLGLIDRRVAAGERQIGWKVGLTAKPIQEQFGFHEPVFGCILDSMPSGSVLQSGALIAPGFESELCLRMAQGLSGTITMAQARAAVAGVHPALEIIETRGDLSAQIALALADNAQQKTVVLGESVPLQDKRLDQVACRVDMNGATVAEGPGAAVLGDPLNSVVWLAGKLKEVGRAIRAGDIIMTGSFVRQFPLTKGDTVRVAFGGIGAVEVRVA